MNMSLSVCLRFMFLMWLQHEAVKSENTEVHRRGVDFVPSVYAGVFLATTTIFLVYAVITWVETTKSLEKIWIRQLREMAEFDPAPCAFYFFISIFLNWALLRSNYIYVWAFLLSNDSFYCRSWRLFHEILRWWQAKLSMSLLLQCLNSALNCILK